MQSLTNNVSNLKFRDFEKAYEQSYKHTATVSHKGTIVAFAMDSQRQIFYSVLALGRTDITSNIDKDFWLPKPKLLKFPNEIAKLGYRELSLQAIAEIKGSDGKADRFRSSTARLSAEAPFQVLSDGQSIFLFRQSLDRTHKHARQQNEAGETILANNNLLVDRFVLVGTELKPKTEVRFQRSRHKTKPQSKKDSLSSRDMNGEPFYEPTQRLEMVHHVRNGKFTVLLLPTSIPDKQRWQIFANNEKAQKMEAFSIEREDDGGFNPRGTRYFTCPHHPRDVFEPQSGKCPVDGKNDLIPVVTEANHGEMALNFEGQGDRMTLNQPIQLGEQWTIEAWIKTPLPEVDAYRTLVMGSIGQEHQVIVAKDGRLGVFSKEFKFKDSGLNLTKLKDGWHHLAAVGKADSTEFWIDGNQNGTVDYQSKAPIAIIGNQQEGQQFGHLDELRIWNVARSKKEIVADKDYRLIGDEPDLAAYWRFDEGKGRTVVDMTDRLHQGTLNREELWTLSDAPVGTHPGVSRSRFDLAGRDFISGPAALLYFQQEKAKVGYDGQEKPQKQNARVMLTVATKASADSSNQNQVAAIDFAVSRWGMLAQTPTVLTLKTLVEEGLTGREFNRALHKISLLETEVRGLENDITRLEKEVSSAEELEKKKIELEKIRREKDGTYKKAVDDIKNYWCQFRNHNFKPNRYLALTKDGEIWYSRVLLENESNLKQRQWEIEPVDNDFYRITNRKEDNYYLAADQNGRWVVLEEKEVAGDRGHWQITTLRERSRVDLFQNKKYPQNKSSESIFLSEGGGQGGYWGELRNNNHPNYIWAIEKFPKQSPSGKKRIDAAKRELEEATVNLARVNYRLDALADKRKELADKQQALSGKPEELKQAKEALKDVTALAMPLVHVDPIGLTVAGGLLDFALATDSPQLLDGTDGKLSLYFPGTERQFLAAHYDTSTSRVRFESPTEHQGKVIFAARHPGPALQVAKISITKADTKADKDQVCTLVMEAKLESANITIAERWEQLPTAVSKLIQIVNGNASTNPDEPDYYNYCKNAKVSAPFSLTRGSILFRLSGVVTTAGDQVQSGEAKRISDGTPGCRWVADQRGHAVAFNGRKQSLQIPKSALHFNADRDVVKCGKNIDLKNKSFTIEFWARRSRKDTIEFIVGMGENKPNIGLAIGFRNTNKFTFAFSANDEDTTQQYDDTAWHHWACVYQHNSNPEHSQWQIFRDGVKQTSNHTGNNRAPFQGEGTFLLGMAFENDHFRGALDEVRVWNSARTEKQIRDHLDSTLTGNEDGLLAYWHFEGRRATDRSGNGHDGSIEGNPQTVFSPLCTPSALTVRDDITIEAWVNPDSVTDRARAHLLHYHHPDSQYMLGLQRQNAESALHFNADRDVVKCGKNIDLKNKSFTIEFWARRSRKSTEEEKFAEFIVGMGPAKANKGLAIGFRKDNSFTFAFFANDEDTTQKYDDTAWHHWACVYQHDSNPQHSQWQIFRDGVKQTSNHKGDKRAPFQGQGIFHLGMAFNTHHFRGDLDEVRVWNSARTKKQIRDHLDSTLTGNEEGLLAYWHFDGRRATDWSGNGHHGSIEGDPQTVESPIRPGYALFAGVGKRFLKTRGAIAVSRSVNAGWTHLAAAFHQSYALEFDSKDHYIECGKEPDLDLTQDLTIEVWLKLDKISEQGILTKGKLSKQTKTGVPYSLFINSEGYLEFRCEDDNEAFKTIKSTKQIRPDTSHRISITRKQHQEAEKDENDKPTGKVKRWSEFQFYIDGESAGRKIINDHTPGSNDEILELGRAYLRTNEPTASHFKGTLSEVRLWQKARKNTEVNKPIDGDEQGLIAWWRMEEREGNFAYDAKGNHHGKLVGPKWIHNPDPAGSTFELYVDGIPRAVAKMDAIDYGQVQFTIGGEDTSSKTLKNAYHGLIDELRLWKVLRTGPQIRNNLFRRLLGEQDNLIAYYTFNEANGKVRDHSGNNITLVPGSEKPDWILSTAPVGTESPRVRNALGGIPNSYQHTISTRPGVEDYGSIQYDNQGNLTGVMKRCYVYINNGTWHLITGFKVGNLITEWISQVQYAPQLIGIIEGAPPVPSENLTERYPGQKATDLPDYKGASGIVFKQADNVNHTYSTSREHGTDSSYEFSVKGGAKGDLSISVGAAVSLGYNLVSFKVIGGYQHSTEKSSGWLNESHILAGETTDRDSQMELHGHWRQFEEKGAKSWRFVPNNLGFALVESDTADVFAMRLEHNGVLVGYRLRPNPDIPRDWNIITFPLNPHYVKQGTLDGRVGLKPDPDYPQATNNNSEYSYYKPTEAYALKQRIARERQRLQDQYAERQQGETPPETQLPDLAKRNIVNTYVWTADGGFFSESTETMDATERKIAASSSTKWLNGLGLDVESQLYAVGLDIEFSAMWGGHLNLLSSKSEASQSSYKLDVTLNVERDLQEYDTDGNPQYEGNKPKLKPGKVDAYRFMSFYLQPSEANFDVFRNKIVDPHWLDASNDPRAVSLRQAIHAQANAGKDEKSEPWRILHRVTFRSRVLPPSKDAQFALAQGTLESALAKADIGSEYEMVRMLEPYVQNSRDHYQTFVMAIRETIRERFPELEPVEDVVVRELCNYFQIYEDV